jgi:hypothetical protein
MSRERRKTTFAGIILFWIKTSKVTAKERFLVERGKPHLSLK